MRNRRLMPSLVSMWMLDIFCCALGCVTLLWLLNSREARMQAYSLAAARADLEETTARAATLDVNYESERHASTALRGERDRLGVELAALRLEREALVRTLGLSQMETESARADLAAARSSVDDLTDAITLLKERDEQTEARLARQRTELGTLTTELAKARGETVDLQALVREREEQQKAMAIKSDTLAERLSDLEARYRAATAKLAELPKAQEEARAGLARAAELEARLRAMTDQLEDTRQTLERANANIIDLQGEKSKLADKFDVFKREQDNRFAGVAMTGRRVVFLIDISGSMNQADSRTLDPEKWPLVCETLAKVMRSIPPLEKFQVILFSSDVHHLMGGENGWLEFSGEATVKEVKDRMLRVTPQGSTNMYLGMQATFLYRGLGLDTVYLFSDGLPTSGPGLDPGLTVSEVDRTTRLSNYIRTQLNERWNQPVPGREKVKINSIGFFYESPDVGAFLWTLSRESDGSFVGLSRP